MFKLNQGKTLPLKCPGMTSIRRLGIVVVSPNVVWAAWAGDGSGRKPAKVTVVNRKRKGSYASLIMTPSYREIHVHAITISQLYGD